MMDSFRIFLAESKGIRVTDELESEIDRIFPQVHQAALRSKETGEDIEVGSLQYNDQYSGKRRTIDIQVINDPGDFSHGSFNAFQKQCLVNVAHVKPEEITLRWARRILVHEIGIHSQDPKVSDFDVFSKLSSDYVSDPNDPNHHTQDIEFDAYSGQIVDSLLKGARSIRGTERVPEFEKLLDDTLTFIKNPVVSGGNKIYGIIADPDYWKTFNRYYHYSKPEQRRKFYLRVYKAVIDARKILNEI